jgi:hypothetical protein
LKFDVINFDVNPEITVCIDLFFVNSVMFLLTVSRGKVLYTHAEVLGRIFHPSTAERAVRSLKDICRAIVHARPYQLCSALIVYLVYHAVMVRNTPKNSSFAIPPRVLFRGRRTEASLTIQLEFGEFVHIHEDDTTPRNSLALISTRNVQGSYLFYVITTGKVVARRSWTAIPMSAEVIVA